MTDAINAKSDVLGERELDRVSGGFIVKGGLEGVCSKGEGMVGGGGPMGMMNEIMQLVQQVQR